MAEGWAAWLSEHHAEETGAERAVRLARQAEHRDDRQAERTEAERSAALAERRELLEVAALQSGIAARSLDDVFSEAGRLGDEDAAYNDALRTIERIERKREARQRDQLARAEHMTAVTDLASRSATTATGGPDLLGPAKAAHQEFLTVTRAKIRDAAAGAPRQPRPFAVTGRSSGGNAVRSEHCIYCTDSGVTDETSYLLHSDPELAVPVTPPPHAEQPVRAERRTPMIYAGTEISR
jgi:hypothetical protein